MVRQVKDHNPSRFPSKGTVISDTKHTSCFEAICIDSTTGVTEIPYGTLMMFDSFDSHGLYYNDIVNVKPWVGGDTTQIVGMLVRSEESFNKQDSTGIKVYTVGKILTDGRVVVPLNNNNGGTPAIGGVVQAYNTVGANAKHDSTYSATVNASISTPLNDDNVKALFIGTKNNTLKSVPIYFSVIKDGAANNKYGYFPAISE